MDSMDVTIDRTRPTTSLSPGSQLKNTTLMCNFPHLFQLIFNQLIS